MAVLKNKIELKNVSKVYETRDKQVEVLNNLSFEVHENEFLVLLGPGRCGKTVLLNILANLEKQTSGTIEFAGGRPKMGDLGMVFQKYALFPWKTVMGNVEMSQKLKGVDKKVRQEKAQEYINLVGLKGFENSLPKQLSGGMKQRIGIALILLHLPRILVVDEPTAGLDPRERIRFRNLLVELSKDRIVIFSTHIIEDISSSCSQVAVINKGSLKYFGDPVDMVGMAAGKVWQFDIDKTEFEQALDKSRIVNHIQKDDRIRVRYLSVTSPHDEAVQVEPNLEDAYLCLLKGI